MGTRDDLIDNEKCLFCKHRTKNGPVVCESCADDNNEVYVRKAHRYCIEKNTDSSHFVTCPECNRYYQLSYPDMPEAGSGTVYRLWRFRITPLWVQRVLLIWGVLISLLLVYAVYSKQKQKDFTQFQLSHPIFLVVCAVIYFLNTGNAEKYFFFQETICNSLTYLIAESLLFSTFTLLSIIAEIGFFLSSSDDKIYAVWLVLTNLIIIPVGTILCIKEKIRIYRQIDSFRMKFN